jgi:hypothetical protein
MADIFVSYAREDSDRVAALVSGLERLGWSVFWDRRIPAGETWRSYIGNALEGARCVLVAWSRHSIGSSWVLEEAEDAKHRGVLVPVLLEQVELPRGFREIQTADLTGWTAAGASPTLDALAQDLRRRLGGQAGPPPMPSASHRPEPRAARRRTVPWIAAGALVAAVAAAAIVRLLSPPARPPAMTGAAPPAAAVPTTGASATTVPQAAPPEPAPGPNEVRAVVSDPDGYTNLRTGPGTSFDVRTRVREGEVFTTTISPGEWWPVTTQNGVTGYIHRSRIRVLR